MKDIAWIGNLEYFYKKFKTNDAYYIDKQNNITYWCIHNLETLSDKYFDSIEVGTYIDGMHKYFCCVCSWASMKLKEGFDRRLL